jgi:hypothetical protein
LNKHVVSADKVLAKLNAPKQAREKPEAVTAKSA